MVSAGEYSAETDICSVAVRAVRLGWGLVSEALQGQQLGTMRWGQAPRRTAKVRNQRVLGSQML